MGKSKTEEQQVPLIPADRNQLNDLTFLNHLIERKLVEMSFYFGYRGKNKQSVSDVVFNDKILSATTEVYELLSDTYINTLLLYFSEYGIIEYITQELTMVIIKNSVTVNSTVIQNNISTASDI